MTTVDDCYALCEDGSSYPGCDTIQYSVSNSSCDFFANVTSSNTTDDNFHLFDCQLNYCDDCVDLLRRCANTSSQRCVSDLLGTFWASSFLRRNTTVTGIECQSWSSQNPHGHSFYEGEATGGGWGQPIPSYFFQEFERACLIEGNTCGNPDQDTGPWCYTMDPNTRYEPCFPTCGCYFASGIVRDVSCVGDCPGWGFPGYSLSQCFAFCESPCRARSSVETLVGNPGYDWFPKHTNPCDCGYSVEPDTAATAAGVITSLSGIEPDTCLAHCDAEAACVGVVYRQHERECGLKSTYSPAAGFTDFFTFRKVAGGAAGCSGCEADPCSNGGTCHELTQPGKFYCTCTDEYHGPRCEGLYRPWLLQLRRRSCDPPAQGAQRCYYFWERP